MLTLQMAPKIKLAKKHDEGDLNFFERHPKKILAAGGVLGAVALHRLMKGGKPSIPVPKSAPAAAPRIKTPAPAPKTGGDLKALNAAPKAEAPKIKGGPEANATPKMKRAPRNPEGLRQWRKVHAIVLESKGQVPPGLSRPKALLKKNPPHPGDPKTKGYKGNRKERMAEHAAKNKQASVQSFALWASLQ